MKTSSCYRYIMLDPQDGSDRCARQPAGFKVWYVFLAVHQVSRGISVKWILTNVAQHPATMVPFAKILLISTPATAGQVSHSDFLWISQFTWKWVSQAVHFPLEALLQETFMYTISKMQPGGCFTAPLRWLESSLPYVNHVNSYRMPLLDWKGAAKGYHNACVFASKPYKNFLLGEICTNSLLKQTVIKRWYSLDSLKCMWRLTL